MASTGKTVEQRLDAIEGRLEAIAKNVRDIQTAISSESFPISITLIEHLEDIGRLLRKRG